MEFGTNLVDFLFAWNILLSLGILVMVVALVQLIFKPGLVETSILAGVTSATVFAVTVLVAHSIMV